MFAYEPPINPPCDMWEEYKKPEQIMNLIQSACSDILKRGEETRFQDILDLLYEHFDEKILDYTEECYEA